MNRGGPLRVLHLRDSPWVDGPGRTIIESAAHFDAAVIDYHIGVFVRHEGTQHPMLEEAAARQLHHHAIVDRGGLDRRVIAAIVELVDRLRIDILHSSDFRSRLYARIVGMRRSHLRQVTTTHGWIANDTKLRLKRTLDKFLLRRFHHVVMVSHAMRELVPSWWVPDRRITVLHNAVVLPRRNAGEDPDRVVPDVSRWVTLLNVGRLSPEKGQDLLLHAIARLLPEYPGIRLRFAGIGPCLEALQSLAAKLGLAERVRFMGYVKEMSRVYADVDLVVQSSLTEGLPNVMLEAAFYGVPVVATDVGGTREVIGHGGNGWLVKSGSVDELANGLRRYLAQPAEFVRMAASGRSRIEAEFSMPARTARMTQIYLDVAASRT